MPQPKPPLNKDSSPLIVSMKKIRAALSKTVASSIAGIKRTANRRTFAYLFMISFILLTSVGAGLIFPPAGFIVAGITCGLFGFLLGTE